MVLTWTQPHLGPRPKRCTLGNTVCPIQIHTARAITSPNTLHFPALLQSCHRTPMWGKNASPPLFHDHASSGPHRWDDLSTVAERESVRATDSTRGTRRSNSGRIKNRCFCSAVYGARRQWRGRRNPRFFPPLQVFLHSRKYKCLGAKLTCF